MHDSTLIVFMSDNGGNTLSMLSGDADVSKLKLPADNGPYRGGKGMLYEGGTRVAALANWPGRIKAGEVKEVMHVVDMFPTLAGLAGAPLGKGKTLDGMDGTEVVYNIEPFRGGVRQGDWKLIWRTPLPPHWSSTTWLKILRKKPISPTRIRRKSLSCRSESSNRLRKARSHSSCCKHSMRSRALLLGRQLYLMRIRTTRRAIEPFSRAIRFERPKHSVCQQTNN